MLMRRIIPRLDVAADGSLVVAPDGAEATDLVSVAAEYAAQGADEILVWFVGPPEDGWDARLERVAALGQRVFVPVTVAGGISSAEIARAVVTAGADRVCLGEEALARPALIGEVAAAVGGARVLVAADVRRRAGSWQVFIEGGRTPARREALRWTQDAVALGAGEILLTSIDRSSQDGFDLSLAHSVAVEIEAPSIVGGGGATAAHFADVCECGVDGVIAGLAVHHGAVGLPEIKELLAQHELPTRPLSERTLAPPLRPELGAGPLLVSPGTPQDVPPAPAEAEPPRPAPARTERPASAPRPTAPAPTAPPPSAAAPTPATPPPPAPRPAATAPAAAAPAPAAPPPAPPAAARADAPPPATPAPAAPTPVAAPTPAAPSRPILRAAADRPTLAGADRPSIPPTLGAPRERLRLGAKPSPSSPPAPGTTVSVTAEEPPADADDALEDLLEDPV